MESLPPNPRDHDQRLYVSPTAPTRAGNRGQTMKRIILAALVGVLFSGPAGGQVDLQHQRMCPVSYTLLTLPTICRV